MPRLCAIVCANGLGHHRRMLGVLDQLLQQQPDTHVTLIASQWQHERVRGWATATRVLSQAVCVDGVVEPGVQWSTDPAVYDDGRLLSWVERLRAVPAVHEADVVVSDNLVGVLDVAPHAQLLGSFVWSDVLDDVYRGHAAVDAFVAHERALLQAHKPPMVCVAEFTMPGVRERTRPHGVGLMVEPDAAPSAGPRMPPRIALLGGATGVADDVLVDVARALLHEEDVAVVASPAVARRAAVAPFDFSPGAYAACDVVVCRPGMGTLTACVGACVPIVALEERDNSEMQWNAAVVERLGIGTRARAGNDVADIVRAVRRALLQQQDMRAALRAQQTGGLQQAAAHLMAALGRAPSVQEPA